MIGSGAEAMTQAEAEFNATRPARVFSNRPIGAIVGGAAPIPIVAPCGALTDSARGVHKRTAVGSGHHAATMRQSTPAVSVLRRLHAHTEADPPGRSVIQTRGYAPAWIQQKPPASALLRSDAPWAPVLRPSSPEFRHLFEKRGITDLGIDSETLRKPFRPKSPSFPNR